MKVMELLDAMANIIELAHLYYIEVGKGKSSLGVYETYSIPEKFANYEVSHFYIYDVDGNTHVDIVVKK